MTKNDGVVFFVHPVKPEKNDIRGALDFGRDATFINTDYIFADQITDRLPMVVDKVMDDAAERFDPERDCLAIVGDHLQLIAFAAKLGARYPTFRVLRWDRDQRGYVPVWVECNYVCTLPALERRVLK